MRNEKNYIQELRHDSKKAYEFFAKRLAYTLGPVELSQMMKEGKVKLIDIRYKPDFKESHIPEAINLEIQELAENLEKLSKKDVHVIYCYNQQCHLGVRGCKVLAEHGYPVMELEGGFKVWKDEFKFPTISS